MLTHFKYISLPFNFTNWTYKFKAYMKSFVKYGLLPLIIFMNHKQSNYKWLTDNYCSAWENTWCKIIYNLLYINVNFCVCIFFFCGGGRVYEVEMDSNFMPKKWRLSVCYNLVAFQLQVCALACKDRSHELLGEWFATIFFFFYFALSIN